MADPDDFTFEHHGGRYERHLPAHWCFSQRAFGGYTAALALAAILAETGRPVAASLHVTFLEAGLEGHLGVGVEVLRAGRSAAVARATVIQHDRPILLATAWLVDGWGAEAEAPAGALFTPLDTPAPPPPVPPAEGSELRWLTDSWPALRFAERRGVDYPVSWDEFARGRPEVALWLRVLADDAGADPLPSPQLGDVLHLDAHLFDAPGQITGFDDAAMLSLDLDVAWQPGAHLVPSTAWRLYEGRGSTAPGGVTSFGSLRDEAGALLAVATSQGLLRR